MCLGELFGCVYVLVGVWLHVNVRVFVFRGTVCVCVYILVGLWLLM